MSGAVAEAVRTTGEKSAGDVRHAAAAYFESLEIPADIHVQPERPERPNIVHADPLDNVRFIAWAMAHGSLDGATMRYLDIQRATRLTESRGSFDTSVIIPFVDGRLEILGEEARRSRLRSVLAAQALEATDPGFGFYRRRTMYELFNTSREEAMMRDEPVGSFMAIISPCEPTVYGRRLGMFPERDMAALQVSVKLSPNEMLLRTVSLDRASLGIVRQLLAEEEVDVPAGAAPEDYVAYPIRGQFDGEEDVQAFVQAKTDRFDDLVMQYHPTPLPRRPRQGIVPGDARDQHTTLTDVLDTPHGQCALRQEHKLDAALARHLTEAVPLAPVVHALAKECIHGERANGEPLLLPAEAQHVRALVAAEAVDFTNPDHVAGASIVIQIHQSAIEESLRDFLAGNEHALDWMDGETLSLASVRHIVKTGITAIENGRGASGCGLGSELGGLPDFRSNPDGYLRAKYGEHGVQHGRCALCGRRGLVGKCDPAFCGRCDGEDSKNPGYISRRMRMRQLLAQLF